MEFPVVLRKQLVDFLSVNLKQRGISKVDQENIMWNFQRSLFQALKFLIGGVSRGETFCLEFPELKSKKTLKIPVCAVSKKKLCPQSNPPACLVFLWSSPFQEFCSSLQFQRPISKKDIIVYSFYQMKNSQQAVMNGYYEINLF